MRRPTEEINAEVAALRALKPVGFHARKTAASIDAQVDAIQHGVDDTCDEWHDLSDEEQMAARDAEEWADGHSVQKPSQGYDTLVA